jgi:hypothetical protein
MKKILLAILLSVFLLSAMTVPSLAQYDWDVGIDVGDTFKYEGTLVLWESDGASFPPMMMDFLQTWNESDWLEYTVTDIEELYVTFEVTTHWKNGTETVETKEDNMTSSLSPFVIGANLEEGDEIRAAFTSWGTEYPTQFLNASVMREYASGPKETNVLIYDTAAFGNHYHSEFLFDKATGMRVYFQYATTDAHDMSGNTYSFNATLELIETNVEGWTVIPEFPTGTAMLLIFIAVTVCVDIYRRKKLKRQIG